MLEPSAILAATTALLLQQGGLLDPDLRDLLHEELSGELAKEHVIGITRFHRVQASRGYREAARYVIEQLRDMGFGVTLPEMTREDLLAAGDLDEADPAHASRRERRAPAGSTLVGDGAPQPPFEAWIESFPSDGRVVYQTWQSPSGWDIDSAELRVVSIDGEPADELIVRFPEIAMSLVTYSNPGDVTAPLVWVGAGESEADYEGKDVAGKLVLATGYGGAVHRLAVLKHGAAAVVCFLDDERAADHPDMLQYTGMWPKTDELERTTFGFNLTHRQGARLRDMLLAGKEVVLHGQAEGIGLEPYFLDVVTAVIRGSERPDEELVFCAHLDHPKESANDNASGSGAILDIARALKTLIDDGRLPQPKRTLRFYWVPEWHGTMAYIDAHESLAGPEISGKILACMNLDMVGENLELLHSKLILTRTPDSLPSCVNDVVADMAAMVDGMDVRTPRGSQSIFNYRVTPYSGGSDHMMFIDRKIPAVMFSHDPDWTHHTSEDTPDKVDPVELERCEIIAAGTIWYLANLGSVRRTEPLKLRDLVHANAVEELGRHAGGPMAWLDDSGAEERSLSIEELGGAMMDALYQSNLDLWGARLRGEGALDSLTTFGVPRELIEKRLGVLGEQDAHLFMASQDGMTGAAPPAPAGVERIPVRLTRGPLDFGLPESRLPAGASFALGSEMRFELVNLIDGKRSVVEIRDALSAQFGPVAPSVVLEYIEGLAMATAVKWEAKEESL